MYCVHAPFVGSTINVSLTDPTLQGMESDDLATPLLPHDDDNSDRDHEHSCEDPAPPPASTEQSSAISSSNADRTQSSTPAPDPHTKKRKRGPVESLQPGKFNREMTAQVMLWFDDCRKRGLFNSTKKRDYGPVWSEVLERVRERWPQFSWTKQSIASKYDTERRRFQLWKSLVDGYSGVTYDHSTGLPSMSESTWEQFVARHKTKTKSVAWLRSVPLGDVEVYRSVFFRERASDSEDSGRDIQELLDDEDDDNDDVSTQTPVPKRLTAPQRQRRHNDDGLKLTRIIHPLQIAKHQWIFQLTTEIFVSSLREAVAVLAAPQLPAQHEAIASAVRDVLKLFASTLSKAERANCLDQLQDLNKAVMWKELDFEMKQFYVERWKTSGL
ncbi:hypothetical protein C8A03DRAFT_46030 [Achaetomium macrosporum]|uniref:Myb/SANT-like domain-containing protein n=1 Tax=Achaetomium macrosporum TaxID=79813 RepID=A0AAN7C5Q8_9PEZI|nr:hypothetical protein C8A03DRAFT_46030 [Achaetomium macrosporum]